MTQRKDGLATVEEAAQFLSVCRGTIWSMYTSGELLTVKVRNARRIPWTALYEIVDSATIDSEAVVEKDIEA